MGNQEIEFIAGEGDAWYHRNVHKRRHSYVLDALKCIKIEPMSALEIGCGDGLNIAEVVHHYGCSGDGIDPSTEALKAATAFYPEINFMLGTAAAPELDGEYDLLIYGFCLYVCDPETIPTIVFCGDDLLEDGGYLAIHDFDPEYPHKVPYHHVPGMFSYKMNYAGLWLANPAYSLVLKNPISDGTAVWILKKDIETGWPLGTIA